MRALLVIACSVGLLVGCGYRLADGGGGDVPTLVSTFANDSLEPGAELVLGAALRRELGRSGVLRPVDTPVVGGYRIEGRVLRVQTLGRTFTPGVRALEYTLTMRLQVVVQGPDGRPIRLDPFATHASEIYLASTDVQIARKNREEALRRIAAILASRIRREIERAVGSS